MIGKYTVIVRNARVRYKFTIERSVTILRGDSATGKTTLIEMLESHQRNGVSSGVDVRCAKPCVVLPGYNWQLNLSQISDSIVFIDEGDDFVRSQDFAIAIQKSNNYYVIATRSVLYNIPYSVNEVYGIKNLALFLPESFEWLVLKSGILHSNPVNEILESPADHIESGQYFSWERFFTALLTDETRGSYLQYSKKKLNPAYLQVYEKKAVIRLIPPFN